MRARLHHTVFAALLAAGPALAQSAAPQPAPDPAPDTPIVVTGERPTLLVVDMERVARRCIACRRALQRLRAETARHQAQTARSRAETGGPLHGDDWGRGVTPLQAAGDMHRQALRTQQEAGVRAARALERAEAPDRAAGFTANLLRLVEPIVEQIRLERGAEAVHAPRDPAVRGRAAPDITAAVVEALDRDHQGADLLADAP